MNQDKNGDLAAHGSPDFVSPGAALPQGQPPGAAQADSPRFPLLSYPWSTSPSSPRTRVPPLRARPAGTAGMFLSGDVYLRPSLSGSRANCASTEEGRLIGAVGDHTQLGHLSRRGGEPTQWRAPGELSLRHLPDRILTPGRGVRSVTKAPPSELTLLDLHHQ